MTDGWARRALGGSARAGEPAEGGRHIDGVAVPWSAEATGTAEFGDLVETFDRHAFDAVIATGRRVPILDRHDGNVVGMAEPYVADDGLRFRGNLLADDPAAEAFARRVAAGADGVSIEFRPGRVRRGARSVVHMTVDRLAAIAGAYAPALDGASVALRRANPMTEPRTPDPEPEPPEPTPTPTPSLTEAMVESIATRVASRQAADLRRLIAEGGHMDQDPGLVFRSLADAWRAVDAHRDDPSHREWYTRALVDITTSDVPGVMTPGVQGQVRGILDPGRPGITAFGREALGEGGMTVQWPYFSGTLSGLIGLQLTEKSEITSAEVPILAGSAAIKTWAGGADISYQTLRRSQPSYLEAWSRIMLAAYAAVTDKAFVDAVEAAATGAVTLDWAAADNDAVRAGIFAASVAVQDATGRPAEFVLAAADTFAAIGGALNPAPIQNATGTADARTLAPVLSGLPVRYDPNVDAGTAIVSNGLTAAWHEDGPLQASEEDVAKLGRNVAYYGLAAPVVYLPAGVVILGPTGAAARQAKAPAKSAA